MNNPSKLIPLIIAGGGGGMADISSENNPDAINIFDDNKMILAEVVPDFDTILITKDTRSDIRLLLLINIYVLQT